ncbi:MAG: hypothetical protein ACNA8P_05400 [Phycisphaerales bacterium]
MTKSNPHQPYRIGVLRDAADMLTHRPDQPTPTREDAAEQYFIIHAGFDGLPRVYPTPFDSIEDARARIAASCRSVGVEMPAIDPNPCELVNTTGGIRVARRAVKPVATDYHAAA